MKETPITVRRKETTNGFLEGKSVLDAVNMMLSLEGIKPYLEISSDEEITNYFKNKGIEGVKNKEDLLSFYDKLEQRVAELGEESDERIQLYVKKKELLSLSSSKIEQLVNEGFEELKNPFKNSLEYIFDAVINKNVRIMNIKDEVSVEKEERYMFYAAVNLDFCSAFQRHYFRIGKTFSTIQEKIKGKGLFPNYKRYIQIDNVEPVIIHLADNAFFKGAINNLNYFEHNSDEQQTRTIDEFIDFLKEKSFEDRGYLKNATAFIKTVLNLPKKMEGYIQTTEKELREIFKG